MQLHLGLIAFLSLSVIVAAASPASAQQVLPVDDGATDPRLRPVGVREERVAARAENVGLGLDWGLWGEGFAQSVHLDVPVFGNSHGAFGVRARGVIAYGPATSARFDPAVFGDFELFGRGPVLLGLARLYGGGGLFVGAAPEATPKSDRNLRVSGGGHMGIEIFASSFNSFYVEVGGQGPLHPSRFDAGGSVMGGVTFYPFGR